MHCAHALAYAIGRAEVEEIDAINILQASLLAMQRAVEALAIVPDAIQVDGIHHPKVAMPCEAIIGGDAIIPAISVASIIAKVTRDREMMHWDKIYPGYGFAQHKGYPTAAHVDRVTALGITPIHRKTFAPIKHFQHSE